MPRITIQSIPQSEQRYPTVGDWTYDKEGNMEIKVSEMDRCSFYAVALHELTEAILCWNVCISPESVDRWDLAHKEDIDPGGVHGCPYADQHKSAEAFEILLISLLHYTWLEHELEVDRVQFES